MQETERNRAESVGYSATSLLPDTRIKLELVSQNLTKTT